MPIEAWLLDQKPGPVLNCPRCLMAFRPFMRGQVQSTWRRLLGLPYCCVICDQCKEIVGHEKP